MPICLDGLSLDEYKFWRAKPDKLEIQTMLDSDREQITEESGNSKGGVQMTADVCLLPSGESPGQLECGKCWAVRRSCLFSAWCIGPALEDQASLLE